MRPDLPPLSASEAGFVLGAALIGAPATVIDGLAGGEGARCQQALTTLGTLPSEQRVDFLAALGGDVLSAVPAAIEQVHRDWLLPALAGESTSLLRAAMAGWPPAVAERAAAVIVARGDDPTPRPTDQLDDETLAAVQRAIFVDIVAPCPVAGPWSALAGEHGPALLDGLAGLGAETIGASLRGAPRPVIARAAAQVGEPGAERLMDAATRPGSPQDRQTARALVAAVGSGSDETELGAAIAIGLMALAHALVEAPDEAAMAIAQRLPMPLGRSLLAAIVRARAELAR
jgi:hypothetical protein